eukprot:gene282-299_t
MNATNKGLIFLEAKSCILYELLAPRLLEGKREACEINFGDFDDVSFRILCDAASPQIVSVHMAIHNYSTLKSLGSQELLERLYPGCLIPPADGFHVAIQFNCDQLPGPASEFLTTVSELRRNVMAGPLDRAFDALVAKTSSNLPVMVVEYRPREPMFISSLEGKIIVTYAVDFGDVTDRAIARVFLQEFVEAQRLVRNAPPVSFSREVPPTLSRVNYPFDTTKQIAGYVSFAVEDRHVSGVGKDKVMTLLTGFRNYLHYHIKGSKTYLHMRMRKKVAGWMQVLNRAVPEIEGEKKTAAGKTFVRK